MFEQGCGTQHAEVVSLAKPWMLHWWERINWALAHLSSLSSGEQGDHVGGPEIPSQCCHETNNKCSAPLESKDGDFLSFYLFPMQFGKNTIQHGFQFCFRVRGDSWYDFCLLFFLACIHVFPPSVCSWQMKLFTFPGPLRTASWISMCCLFS